jgi:hypothetical protein
MPRSNNFAGIEYAGIAGASQDCQEAVMRLLQFGDCITRARILTHENKHCLMLTYNVGDLIAIRSGFASGYGGEGPTRFSFTLQLLDSHGAEIEEYAVEKGVIERVDEAALRRSDVVALDNARPVRPSLWPQYILEKHYDCAERGKLWASFPPVVPLRIIDARIIDLALKFWEGPDDRLLKGYRRLEDIIRKRTGLSTSASKLFSQAFIGPPPKLFWNGIDEGERIGRGTLFTAVYTSHRNARAHRELECSSDAQLSEFLLLNHLYRLEQSGELRNGTG